MNADIKMKRAGQLAGLAVQWYSVAENKPYPTQLVLRAQANKWVTEATRLRNEAMTEMGLT